MKALWTMAVMAAIAGSAGAQEADVAFVTPSGNITCQMIAGDPRGVSCELGTLTPSYPIAPAECQLDWGAAFWIAEAGSTGQLLCGGGTFRTGAEVQVLPYGYSLTHVGVTCQSEATGLTCTNAAGHGFFLSKARQQVF